MRMHAAPCRHAVPRCSAGDLRPEAAAPAAWPTPGLTQMAQQAAVSLQGVFLPQVSQRSGTTRPVTASSPRAATFVLSPPLAGAGAGAAASSASSLEGAGAGSAAFSSAKRRTSGGSERFKRWQAAVSAAVAAGPGSNRPLQATAAVVSACAQLARTCGRILALVLGGHSRCKHQQRQQEARRPVQGRHGGVSSRRRSASVRARGWGGRERVGGSSVGCARLTPPAELLCFSN